MDRISECCGAAAVRALRDQQREFHACPRRGSKEASLLLPSEHGLTTYILVGELLLEAVDLALHFLDLPRCTSLIQPTYLSDLRLVLAVVMGARPPSQLRFGRPRRGSASPRSEETKHPVPRKCWKTRSRTGL